MIDSPCSTFSLENTNSEDMCELIKKNCSDCIISEDKFDYQKQPHIRVYWSENSYKSINTLIDTLYALISSRNII